MPRQVVVNCEKVNDKIKVSKLQDGNQESKFTEFTGVDDIDEKILTYNKGTRFYKT